MKIMKILTTTLALVVLSISSFALPPVGPTIAGDLELVVHDPVVMSTRQLYATGDSAIDQTLSISTMNTHNFELISIRLHLDAVGGAGDFVVTQDSYLGPTYDTVLLTQDMTTVTDLYQTYQVGEAVFDNNDKITFTWANAGNKTYGLEVLYRQK